MKILGENLNFASLADVNSDPTDPIMSYRSFGADKINVASKITAFVRGMQDNGVLACAKQFSINGLTISDYNNEIPLVRASVDSVTAYAFTRLFENNVRGVMPASSNVPPA